MKKQALRYFSLTLLLSLLAGCGTTTTTSSGSTTSESTTTPPAVGSVTEIVPDETGGGQVDDENDYNQNDISALKEILTDLSAVRNYTYETTYAFDGYQESVIDYYGEHHFYEENLTNPDFSFGIAEEAYTGADHKIFYFHCEEQEDRVIPHASLYEYSSLSLGDDAIEPVTDLFGALGITGLHTIYQEALDSLTGLKLNQNTYMITSASMFRIFQFMTQVGTSISDSMTACKLEINDPISKVITVTIELGDSGQIVSKLTPNNNTKYAFLDDQLKSGALKGVPYYDDVVHLFEDKLNQNNYTLQPVNYDTATSHDVGTFSVKLNENFFFVDFNDQANNDGYADWGRILVPSNTKVTVVDPKTGESTEMCNAYTSCYQYRVQNGQVVVTYFIGPKETETMKFIEVETYADLEKIPEDQRSESYLYIVKEENYTYVYEIINGTTNEKGFKKYNPWYKSVGDFAINSGSATFYTSSGVIGNIARYYFQKDFQKENTYYTKDSSVLSLIANSLFGWGVFSNEQWMSYVLNSTLTVNKAESDEITGARLALDVATSSGNNQVSYDFTDFGTTSIPLVEEYYNALMK